jgi:hypothetical protein
MTRSHRQLGLALMAFSWGYVWQKWRATLQVEPLFLDPAGNLTRASVPCKSQPGALGEGNDASIEQPSASRGDAVRSDPKIPRNTPH